MEHRSEIDFLLDRVVRGEHITHYESVRPLRDRSSGQGRSTDLRVLDVAEQRGLIHDLGSWVLETACTQAADWVRRFGAAASVVAEGIRTVRQRDILTDLGCACGQGWLWHPAVSGEQIGTLLSPHGRSSHRRR